MAIAPGKCLLYKLLRERKVEVYSFASSIGMSKQQLSDYANNRFIMSLKTAKNIADALDVPIDDLYEWNLIETPPSRKKKG